MSEGFWSRAKRGLRRRHPWAAAFLNFFMWGSGYLYAGRRLFLGGALSLFIFVVLLAGEVIIQDPARALALVFAAWLFLSAALAHDAYADARERNKKIEEEEKKRGEES
jgi:hypothetical protein